MSQEVFFLGVFLTKILCAFLASPMRDTLSNHLILLDIIIPGDAASPCTRNPNKNISDARSRLVGYKRNKAFLKVIPFSEPTGIKLFVSLCRPESVLVSPTQKLVSEFSNGISELINSLRTRLMYIEVTSRSERTTPSPAVPMSVYGLSACVELLPQCRSTIAQSVPPNVMAEWLTPCFVFVRSQVQISTKDRLSWLEIFRGFPQPFQANAGRVPESWATISYFQIISNSSFTYRPFILCYIVGITEKVSLNELKLQTSFHQRGWLI
jgi:hypothetical protein